MAEVLASRYELGRRLGAGGMAEVFEARDLRLGRRVAVKILRADLPDQRARDRFEHEARISAGFDHPDAVTIYDVGEDGGRPYLVMELVEGRDLARHLAQVGALSAADAVAMIDPVLRALAAAHERGLVHRDVKPGNILLGDDGRVRLADFGIAKALADAAAGLTAPGQVIGTPRYLAPEQVRGERATPRSDVYAAGIVLYESLTGEPPYPDETAIAIAADPTGPAPAASLVRRRPDLPAALAAVVDRALSADPARRHHDAADLRLALLTASHTPDAAPPPTAVLPVVQPTAVMPAAAPNGTAASAAAPGVAPPPNGDRTIALDRDRAAGPVGPTGALPAEPVARDAASRRRRTVGIAAAAVLGLGAVVGAAAALRPSDAGNTAPNTTVSPTTAVRSVATTATTAIIASTRPLPVTILPATSAAASTSTSVTQRSTTTTVRSSTTSTSVPSPTSDSLDRLVSDVAADPAAAGAQGPALLVRLRAVQAVSARKRGGRELQRAAADALRDVQRWAAEGSLDGPVAQRAITLLGALTN